MFPLRAGWLTAILVVFSKAILAAPIVAGFDVATYANVEQPVNIAFGPSGVLFVGGGGEGAGPAFIHSISSGGAVVSPYGVAPLNDPDAVAFDAAGSISGVSGAVLVGGGGTGVAAIRPDGTIFTVLEPHLFGDINQLRFDRMGRLLMLDDSRRRIAASTGGAPITLVNTPEIPVSFAVDSSNRVFVSLGNGVIQVYGEDGTLLDDEFASGFGIARLAFGSGGAFGTGLYALDNTGTLWQFDGNSAHAFGVGFDARFSFPAFAPEGILYVSEIRENRILRVSPIPEPATLALLGIGLAGLGFARRRKLH